MTGLPSIPERLGEVLSHWEETLTSAAASGAGAVPIDTVRALMADVRTLIDPDPAWIPIEHVQALRGWSCSRLIERWLLDMSREDDPRARVAPHGWEVRADGLSVIPMRPGHSRGESG